MAASQAGASIEVVPEHVRGAVPMHATKARYSVVQVGKFALLSAQSAAQALPPAPPRQEAWMCTQARAQSLSIVAPLPGAGSSPPLVGSGPPIVGSDPLMAAGSFPNGSDGVARSAPPPEQPQAAITHASDARTMNRRFMAEG